MTKKRIKAVFNGRSFDGGLSYVKGVQYALNIYSTPKYPVVIELTSGSELCPYDSIKAFMDNWDLIVTT